MADSNKTTDDYGIVSISDESTVESKRKEGTEYSSIKFTSNSGSIINSSNSDKETLLKVLHGNGIYTRSDFKDYEVFYRFPRMNPYTTLTTTREYVFFTKPDLNLVTNSMGYSDTDVTLQPCLEKIPFFNFLKDSGYHNIFKHLQYSKASFSPFMNLLTNRKTSALDLTPITAETFDTAQNFYGTKIQYRKGSEPADENVEFSVEFEDTRYLDVYLLFKAYDEYEKLKWYGNIVPPKQSYIWYKILHDQFGAFKFIVGEDGEELIHWSQFWGVMPTNVPRDSFTDLPQDGHLKFTISFKAAFVEDMNPTTLQDFNRLSHTISSSIFKSGQSKIYDSDNCIVNGENMAKPYITAVNYSSHIAGMKRRYKLMWNAAN